MNYVGYHRFLCESQDLMDEPKEYGSFKVWFSTGQEADGCQEGWYWWACFPGCSPDSEPNGPFESAEEAYNDARGQ